MNCSQSCDCVAAHSNDVTQTCNITDGTCDCLAMWTGTRCELDVNECEEGTHGCESEPNQGCHNTNGSFECSCLLDYTRDTAGNCVLSK